MPTPRLNGTRPYATTGDLSDIVAANELDAATLLRWRLARSWPAWMNEAECARPEHAHVDFISDSKTNVQRSLNVCGQCRVMQACREWALDPHLPLPHGTAGGMTAGARRVALRARRRPTTTTTGTA